MTASASGSRTPTAISGAGTIYSNIPASTSSLSSGAAPSSKRVVWDIGPSSIDPTALRSAKWLRSDQRYVMTFKFAEESINSPDTFQLPTNTDFSGLVNNPILASSPTTSTKPHFTPPPPASLSQNAHTITPVHSRCLITSEQPHCAFNTVLLCIAVPTQYYTNPEVFRKANATYEQNEQFKQNFRHNNFKHCQSLDSDLSSNSFVPPPKMTSFFPHLPNIDTELLNPFDQSNLNPNPIDSQITSVEMLTSKADKIAANAKRRANGPTFLDSPAPHPHHTLFCIGWGRVLKRA
jgi:hypothetical protein